MSGRIIIARHGNTFAPGEPLRRIGRATDLPLVDSGRVQAEALGEYLASRFTFGAVLAGPLIRTRETAVLIARHLPACPPVTIADWLVEVDHGPDEDRPEAAVVARIGHAALAAWDTHGIAPPGWQVDADTRIAAWRAWFDRRDTADTLLVTSNGAARFALLALGDQRAGGMKLRTGSYGVIADGEVVAWDIRP